MNFDQHLSHLLWLMAPPTTNGWWPYVKNRAEELAMEDSTYASLPALVGAEHERIRAEAESSRKPSKSVSRRKQNVPQANVSRETKDAHTHLGALKSGTGRPAFS